MWYRKLLPVGSSAGKGHPPEIPVPSWQGIQTENRNRFPQTVSFTSFRLVWPYHRNDFENYCFDMVCAKARRRWGILRSKRKIRFAAYQWIEERMESSKSEQPNFAHFRVHFDSELDFLRYWLATAFPAFSICLVSIHIEPPTDFELFDIGAIGFQNLHWNNRISAKRRRRSTRRRISRWRNRKQRWDDTTADVIIIERLCGAAKWYSTATDYLMSQSFVHSGNYGQ